ncbi:MAG: hypothetical protein ABSD57_02735 [Verrucomicrobiota bacterium]
MNALVFLIEHVEGGLHLVPGIMFAVLMLGLVLARQLEQRDEFGIVHAKDRPLIGLVRVHHYSRQPFSGGNDFRPFVPILPRFEVERLLVAQCQQRVASQRIHRLQPAVGEQRQVPEPRVVKTLVLGRAQRAQKPHGHDHG